MKGEWQRVKLGEVVEFVPGFAFKSEVFGQHGSRVIKITNIDEFIDCDNLPFVDIDNIGLAKLEKFRVSVGDYVVAMTGSIGKIGKIVNGEAYINQRVLTVRPNSDVDKSFIYYLLRCRAFTDYMLTHVDSHSVQANISAGTIGKYEFSLPPLPTQRRIAAVLGALDDKIELNRKMNANLEAQAQALFKSWFVDFAPWGGKMPAGWKKGTLGEIAEYSSGRLSVDNVKCEYYSTDGMMADRQGATASALPATGNVVDVDVGDTLVSNIRPYFKKIFHATAKCTCSTDVLCFKPISPCWEYFLYRALWSDDFFAHAVAGAKGTKMPRGDKSQMMCFEIVKPNEDTLVDFNRLISPMCQQIASNVTQCAKLTELRDALLPKLMSGELEVA